MADPLSITASIVAVVQLTSTVVKYISGVRNAPKELKKLLVELSALRGLLSSLEDLTDSEDLLPTFKMLSEPGGSLCQLKLAMEQLMPKLKLEVGKTKVTQILRWPLRKEEVENLLLTIERQKTVLALALQNDLIGVNMEMRMKIEEMHSGMKGLQLANNEVEARDILNWLSPPDPSTNHGSATMKHEPTTGNWLIESEIFAFWKNNPGQRLWLYGIPGCGKTVLCSTIIEHVMLFCSESTMHDCVYFYFDFSQEKKQTVDGFLRSMIAQLSSKNSSIPDEVRTLYEHSKIDNQQPSRASLIQTFISLLKKNRLLYMIVDAVDECSEREELMSLVNQIHSHDLRHLNMVFLSRREKDLTEGMQEAFRSSLCITSMEITEDIKLHVRRRIETDSRLRKWPQQVKEEIEETLVRGSQGMFRWVSCQIDVLRKCLKVSVLLESLQKLPETLDKTYDRIIANIPSEYRSEAYAALQFIVVSVRPLSVEEIAESLAVDLQDHTFKPQNRLSDPLDVLEICSSLITSTARNVFITRTGQWQTITEVRLAHYSVKEYLLSDRVLGGRASMFHISETKAHSLAGTVCLAYLLYHIDRGLPLQASTALPLQHYAKTFWNEHVRVASTNLEQHILTQLSVDYLDIVAHLDAKSNSPIYPRLTNASLKGLKHVVIHLLASGDDVNSTVLDGKTALMAAASNGDLPIMRILLKNGAHVNVSTIWGRTPLHFAACVSQEQGAKILLDHGAETDLKTGPVAPLKSETEIESILLRRQSNKILESNADADPKTRISERLTRSLIERLIRLQSRSFELEWSRRMTRTGHHGVLDALFCSGLRIEWGSCSAWTPLHEASWTGQAGVAELLIQNNANIEAETIQKWAPLHFAAWCGFDALVSLYIIAGANINTKTVFGWTSLHKASFEGHAKIVQLLLENGADVHAKTCFGWAPIYAAIIRNHVSIVQLLLKFGANIQETGYLNFPGAGLWDASMLGQRAVVETLLENGADVNVKSMYGTTPLEEAISQGHDDIVSLLLGKSRAHEEEGDDAHNP